MSGFRILIRDVPLRYRSPLRYVKLFFFGQGYRLLLNYRIGRALTLSRSPFQFYRPLLRRAQYRKWASDISFDSSIGDNLRLPHPLGIVIGAGVIIGNNVRIFQNVTVGSHGREGHEKQYPRIGDDVTIYAGAKIIGAVSIGDGATIGANAVVVRDIAPGCKAVGVPARIQ